MMRPLALAASVLAGAALVHGAAPTAVAMDASGWYGIDGNWSSIQFLVGTPGQTVNVLVSTATSEFWVIGPYGCDNSPYPYAVCASGRGNLFSWFKSKTWYALGRWQLGLDYLGLPGSGDYGLETVASVSPITNLGFTLNNVITAALNTTNIYNGMLGLGIVEGSFGNKIAESPLTQAVKTFGWIPTYSYGYTAGAYYINGGLPCSLTLGGYDTARFVPHQTNFNINQTDGQLNLLMRGLSISTNGKVEKPSNWTSSSLLVSNMSTSFIASVDTSTPFLWFPDQICDRIAGALGLTYNETFNLYTVSNSQYQALLSQDYSFTFIMSGSDNVDNFGDPLNMPGVVNITISSAAFAHQLHAPFMNLPTGSPGIAYFPLRKLHNTSMAILGRSFFQESYLITQYDSSVFSLHQALYPEDPIGNANLTTMQRPPGSPYPPAPALAESSGLTAPQMAGIGAGSFLLCVIMLLGWWYLRRRRRAKKRVSTAEEDADKDGASSISPDGLSPKPQVVRIFSRIIRKKRSKNAPSESGRSTHPVEVEADCGHELFELPAPIGPIELDATSDTNSLHGETELGTQTTENLSAYEIARRKMDRQLQGPVPAYSPPASGPSEPSSSDKTMQDVSPVDTYRPGESVSPTAPSPLYGNSNTLPDIIPSPMSPHGDWPTSRTANLPSPMTVAPPFPSPLYGTNTVVSGPSSGQGTIPVSPHSRTYDASSLSRSSSANSPSPISPSGSLVPPSPSYQRTPIDPSRVVCLGPLPENMQLPLKSSVSSLPRMVGSDGRSIHMPSLNTLPSMHHPAANRSTSTLGSNFTEEEEEITRQASMSQARAPAATSPIAASGSTRPEGEAVATSSGSDQPLEFIHVPQMAAKRYSWEEADDRDER